MKYLETVKCWNIPNSSIEISYFEAHSPSLKEEDFKTFKSLLKPRYGREEILHIHEVLIEANKHSTSSEDQCYYHHCDTQLIEDNGVKAWRVQVRYTIAAKDLDTQVWISQGYTLDSASKLAVMCREHYVKALTMYNDKVMGDTGLINHVETYILPFV